MARRLLARRRRWLRWAAIALAALTTLAALAQLHHRPAPRRTGTPAGGVRVQTTAPRFDGVAGLVPPGMRAVNLIVPAASTFGGRLAPSSHVDVLAAFDVGPDRAVRRVLASGIVLHVAPQSAPPPAGAPSPFSPSNGRFGAVPVVEVALAVPASREREMVMAQAFGRVFIAVEPTIAGVSSMSDALGRHTRVTAPPQPRPDDALSLRSYLGLPAVASPVAAVPTLLPTSGGPLPPAFPWPPGPAPRLGMSQLANARRGDVTVEVIEGTTRTSVEVLP